MIRVSTVAGDGVLARDGELVVLCAPVGDDLQAVDDALGALHRVARAGGHGDALADQLALVLTGRVIDLVAFAPGSGGLVVSVFGRAWAVVGVDGVERRVSTDGDSRPDGADGDSQRVVGNGGADAPALGAGPGVGARGAEAGQRREVLPGTVVAVRAGLGDSDPGRPVQRWSDLVHGVVRASGVLLAVADELPAGLRPVFDLPAARAAGPERIEPKRPAAPSTPGDPAGGLGAQPVPASRVAPAAAHAGQPAATDPTPTDESEAGLAVFGDPDPVAAGMPGVLVLDDGTVFPLDADYVIGRDPGQDPAVAAGQARALVIEDPEGLLSRVHARIRVTGSEVAVVDLGSSNGTGVWLPGDTGWTRAPARTPITVPPGTQIGAGRRQLRYAAAPGPQLPSPSAR